MEITMKLRFSLLACSILTNAVIGSMTASPIAAPARMATTSVADADAGSTSTGRPSDPNIQYYGRWNRSDSAYYAMGFAGGYLQTGFTGSSIGVRQRNAIDLYYSIDRSAPRWRHNVSGTVTLASGLTSGSHTIR